ncbi:ribbon-helix-helix domain-containing protein [Enterovibrio nigricans]|uniref:Predicted DNA-binding protein, contains Ribbon-helix-helix (RHH) domain n=1 Tax=Enterovibrio nigricans DSM 22720 TaxID=1121868 RepID=A0A1T4V589_9GAMM|nr:ribbon-helix-helix domain-containing protein [Enterovibrio nigricans]PKF50384.1 intracellular proteinase I [Enterovibrio nigricans]SKA60044.1 Predicted DNA-binding protein, contains Ribbon-helix-helix (RHH) domain [Enterovibrio nigricans DSM 22720]
MCQVFIGADKALWESHTRSLRIDGVVTSIRLEQFYWNTLQEIAHRDQIALNKMITNLYFESLEANHDVSNFTSFLRVCCSRYLSLIADGVLVRGDDRPLRQLDAEPILKEENALRNERLRRFN